MDEELRRHPCPGLDTFSSNPSLHDNRHMVIHVLVNIPQKARRNDTHTTECNACQVHILVTLGVCQLTRRNHHIVRGLVASNARDRLQLRQQARGRECDGVADVSGVCNAELELHGATDVLDCVGDEFLDEDIVIGGIADSAADDANGESKRSDSGNEVVGADDGCHDGSWNNDAADAEASEDEETP